MENEEEDNLNPTNLLPSQSDTTSSQNAAPVNTTTPTPGADMDSQHQLLDSESQLPAPLVQTETTVAGTCQNIVSVAGDAVPFVDSEIVGGDSGGRDGDDSQSVLILPPYRNDVERGGDEVVTKEEGRESVAEPPEQPDARRGGDGVVAKEEERENTGPNQIQEEVTNEDEKVSELIDGEESDAVVKNSDSDRKDVNDDANVEKGNLIMTEVDTEKEPVANMGMDMGISTDADITAATEELAVPDEAGKLETTDVGEGLKEETDVVNNLAGINDVAEEAHVEEIDSDRNKAVIDDVSGEAQTSGGDNVNDDVVVVDIAGKVHSSYPDKIVMDENAGKAETSEAGGVENEAMNVYISRETQTSRGYTAKNEVGTDDGAGKVDSPYFDDGLMDESAEKAEILEAGSLKKEEVIDRIAGEANTPVMDDLRNEAMRDGIVGGALKVDVDNEGNDMVMDGIAGEAQTVGADTTKKEAEVNDMTGMVRVNEDQELDSTEKMEGIELAEETDIVDETDMRNISEETGAAERMEDVMKEATEADDKEITDVAKQRVNEEMMESAESGKDTEMAEPAEKTNEAEKSEMVGEVHGEEEEEEEEEEVEEIENVVKSAGGKRKRGRNAKAPVKMSSSKKSEEDVCFICFDGGELVLCDRRGCPKAYHPSCVNRDEAFFKSKGRWNCGWHLCSNCQKNAHYMCFTCTFSLCKGCFKDAVFFCVRGNKGFCEACMKLIMSIERNEAQVDFDDKASWEYLFKDYWIDLKEKLSLTLEELTQASNSLEISGRHTANQESPNELYDAHKDEDSGSDSAGNAEVASTKKRKAKKRLKSRAKEKDSPNITTLDGNEGRDDTVDWASRELLEFVMHMKNGDKSVCSQFDVQALLLEYIKRNKLRDPRRKSQIICDTRLQNLFGKPRVGHFEMLKLLESHFLLKEDSQDDHQGTVVDTEANLLEADGSSDALARSNKDKKRKSRKKGDGRGLQSNIEDYAAIDMHNISLIYLRRSLMEALLENSETFPDKVIGSFVRIRISGNAQKQDLYRLVQVIGTNKTDKQYKVGKRMTNYLLEILNLNKTENVSIDTLSNQEFTEDECKRLRQSIKCGLINRLTVGDIQAKAMALQTVRVEDTLETEITRISHLRDRASDLGRRKELRECVEKLQLLKSPGERQRRLEEYPEIHADPHMDPSYESEEDEEETEENYLKPRGSSFSRGRGQPISPQKVGFASEDSYGGNRSFSSMNRELSRSMSGKGFTSKVDTGGIGESLNDNLRSQGKDREVVHLQSSLIPETRSTLSALKSEPISKATVAITPNPPPPGIPQSGARINETEKIWHYKDPSGKVQGPFSMVQLRKWSNTGYFPADLRIWRATEKQDDSILLTDALNGEIQKVSSVMETSSLKSRMVQTPRLSSTSLGTVRERWSPAHSQATPTPLEVPKYSTDRWHSETSLPSPTPSQHTTTGMARQAYESTWSPTPAQPSSPTSKLGGCAVEANMSHGLTPAAKPEANMLLGSANPLQIHSQPVVLGESPRLQANSQAFVRPDSGGTSVNAVNVKSFHNNPIVATHGWTTGSASKPEMNSPHSLPVSGSQAWGSAPSQKPEPNTAVSLPGQPGIYSSSASSFAMGNPNGVSTVQSNIQPSVASNTAWRMNVPDNQNTAPRSGPENQNTSWGMISGNPNMGWGGSIPANSNQAWAASGQGQAPMNTNSAWVRPGQGQAPVSTNQGWAAPGQRPPAANAFPNWVPPGQGPPSVNANPGWYPPGQGPPSGNANSNWTAPVGNTRGGDSSRIPFKGQRVCKFHESGHCKKGAQCDYLHN